MHAPLPQGATNCAVGLTAEFPWDRAVPPFFPPSHTPENTLPRNHLPKKSPCQVLLLERCGRHFVHVESRSHPRQRKCCLFAAPHQEEVCSALCPRSGSPFPSPLSPMSYQIKPLAPQHLVILSPLQSRRQFRLFWFLN